MKILSWFQKLWRKPSNAGLPPTSVNFLPSLPPKSTAAPTAKPTTSEAKAGEWQADPRSERNIATLEPVTAKLAREHLRRLAALGLNFKVTSARRTWAEQTRLYAQGRTAPGPRVTNARAGYSWHNYGTAYDLTLFSGKNPVWDGKHYDTAGKIGEELGLEWGGRWTRLVDRPHFQRPLGLTLAQARSKYPNGIV